MSPNDHNLHNFLESTLLSFPKAYFSFIIFNSIIESIVSIFIKVQIFFWILIETYFKIYPINKHFIQYPVLTNVSKIISCNFF